MDDSPRRFTLMNSVVPASRSRMKTSRSRFLSPAGTKFLELVSKAANLPAALMAQWRQPQRCSTSAGSGRAGSREVRCGAGRA